MSNRQVPQHPGIRRLGQFARPSPDFGRTARSPVVPPLSLHRGRCGARSLCRNRRPAHGFVVAPDQLDDLQLDLASPARNPSSRQVVGSSYSQFIGRMKGPNPNGCCRPKPTQKPFFSSPYVAGVSISATCGVSQIHPQIGTKRFLPAFSQASCFPRSGRLRGLYRSQLTA